MTAPISARCGTSSEWPPGRIAISRKAATTPSGRRVVGQPRAEAEERKVERRVDVEACPARRRQVANGEPGRLEAVHGGVVGRAALERGERRLQRQPAGRLAGDQEGIGRIAVVGGRLTRDGRDQRLDQRVVGDDGRPSTESGGTPPADELHFLNLSATVAATLWVETDQEPIVDFRAHASTTLLGAVRVQDATGTQLAEVGSRSQRRQQCSRLPSSFEQCVQLFIQRDFGSVR